MTVPPKVVWKVHTGLYGEVIETGVFLTLDAAKAHGMELRKQGVELEESIVLYSLPLEPQDVSLDFESQRFLLGNGKWYPSDGPLNEWTEF